MWIASDPAARRLTSAALLLLLGSSVISASAPLIFTWLLDRLESPFGVVALKEMAFLTMAYVAAHWVARSLGEMRAMYHGRADQRITRRLSSRFFSHVISLPLSYHLEQKAGAVGRTLTNGLLGYRVLLHHLVNSILPVAIELITIGAILAYRGHMLFYFIIGSSAAAYAAVFWRSAQRVSGPAAEVSNESIRADALLTEALLNVETVKAINGEKEVRDSYIAALSRTEQRWVTLYKRRAENGLLAAFVFVVSLGSAVYLGALEVVEGSMSLGELVMVNAYIVQVVRPLELLGFAFRDAVQGVAFVRNMSDLLSEASELDQVSPRAKKGPWRGEVVLNDVSLAHAFGPYVLKQIHLTIPAGRTLAVVGASGSGKTALARLIVRLFTPTRGELYLDGIPFSHIPAAEIRGAVALVAQDVSLFDTTIKNNIAFGRPGATMGEVVEAAQAAGVHDFIKELPNGYETEVGERGYKLSGGERQRIAIARAAIRSPAVLIFDEVTSALDSKSEQLVLSSLAKISRSRTTVIIAHRLSTIAHADEIIVLDRGRIVEVGEHRSLVRADGVYASMWRLQLGFARELKPA